MNEMPEIIKWEAIPDYGDLILIREFMASCNDKFFTDYDGHGYMATETMMSDTMIRPSTIDFHYDDDERFTHVMWFNK